MGGKQFPVWTLTTYDPACRRFAIRSFFRELTCGFWGLAKIGRSLRFAAYVPALLWAGFLLFLGGRSNVPTLDTTLPVDKVAHFALYGTLGALAAFGWVRVRRPAWYWPVIFALLVGA